MKKVLISNEHLLYTRHCANYNIIIFKTHTCSEREVLPPHFKDKETVTENGLMTFPGLPTQPGDAGAEIQTQVLWDSHVLHSGKHIAFGIE